MSKRHRLAIATGALAFAACTSTAGTPPPDATSGSSSPDRSGGASGASPGASGSGVTSLEDREWRLAAVSDGTAIRDVPTGLRATLMLVDGAASGETGCNAFRAPYTLERSRLAFGIVATTALTCGDAAMDLESRYLAALGDVRRFGDHALGVTLLAGTGEPLVTLAPAPVGTITGAWVVTRYRNGAGGIVPPIDAVPLDLRFDEGGDFQGTDGCNAFTGGYTTSGPRITLSGFSGSRSACPSEELAEQEEAYLAALQDSTTWTASGSTLSLRGSDGFPTLTLERSPGG